MALGLIIVRGIPRNRYTSCEAGRYSDESDWLHGFYGERGDGRRKTEGLFVPFRISVRFSNPVYFASVVAQGLHDSIRGIHCVRSRT